MNKESVDNVDIDYDDNNDDNVIVVVVVVDIATVWSENTLSLCVCVFVLTFYPFKIDKFTYI